MFWLQGEGVLLLNKNFVHVCVCAFARYNGFLCFLYLMICGTVMSETGNLIYAVITENSD